MKKQTIIVMLILLGFTNIYAQQAFTLFKQNSSVKVTGTSSIHDWEMHASDLDGKLVIKANGQGIEGFENIDFSVKAKTLVSSSTTMDNKAHDALKVSNYPEIKFNMTSIELKNAKLNNFQGTVTGNLSIAGKTKTILIPFNGNSNDLNTLTVSGNKALKMSDFGIDPPRAMLGALKTGDVVNVIFNFEFITYPQAVVVK